MIKTKYATTDIEVTESLSCDNCGANIPLVFDDPHSPTQQGTEALIIKFCGGYGMYVDPLVQYDLEMLWCQACADGLTKKYTSIAERIGPRL